MNKYDIQKGIEIQKEIKSYLKNHTKINFITEKIKFQKEKSQWANFDGYFLSFYTDDIRPVRDEEEKIVRNICMNNCIDTRNLKKDKKPNSYIVMDIHILMGDRFYITFIVNRYDINKKKFEIFSKIENVLKSFNLYK